jgi:hypothetical protein
MFFLMFQEQLTAHKTMSVNKRMSQLQKEVDETKVELWDALMSLQEYQKKHAMDPNVTLVSTLASAFQLLIDIFLTQSLIYTYRRHARSTPRVPCRPCKTSRTWPQQRR